MLQVSFFDTPLFKLENVFTVKYGEDSKLIYGVKDREVEILHFDVVGLVS